MSASQDYLDLLVTLKIFYLSNFLLSVKLDIQEIEMRRIT